MQKSENPKKFHLGPFRVSRLIYSWLCSNVLYMWEIFHFFDISGSIWRHRCKYPRMRSWRYIRKGPCLDLKWSYLPPYHWYILNQFDPWVCCKVGVYLVQFSFLSHQWIIFAGSLLIPTDALMDIYRGRHCLGPKWSFWPFYRCQYLKPFYSWHIYDKKFISLT